MNRTKSQSVINAETHRFNENASRLLINDIPEFFDGIGFDCIPCGNSYRIRCPVCKASDVWIATANPKAYPIFWGCYSKTCPTQQPMTKKKYVKNLLGLVRACLDDCPMPVAFTAIADYLGYTSSYDITNLDAEAIQGATGTHDRESPPGYCGAVFVVPSEALKALFDEAGVEAVVMGQGIPAGMRTVVVDDPLDWDFLTPDMVRRRARAER